MELKLGKKPARPNSITFKLKDFIVSAKLPKPPLHFGHENTIEKDSWQMLGNDAYGDCVFAGAAHETMLWNLECGKPIKFNDRSVLSDYSALTGFNPNDPNTDQGTDMQAAASYRRKVGIIDANGSRHKVEAYLSIEAGNLKEHYQALYLFGAVGIGIEFPASAMDQFDQGKTWKVVKGGSQIIGGHYVSMVAKRRSLEVVTWGRIQGLTTGFLKKYNDESVVYLSSEMLTENKSPEGFDMAALKECLNSLSV